MSSTGQDSPVAPAPRVEKRRLFLALWPDADVRRSLKKTLEKSVRLRTGRLEPVANLHVTLVFIGNVEAGQFPVIERAVAAMPGVAFEMVLDRIGYWERPGILWFGPRQVPPASLTLVRDLHAALEPCGVAAERRPYFPHVTLARKVRHPALDPAVAPVVWPVASYSLMESVPLERGTSYRELATWLLHAGDKLLEPQGLTD